MPQMRGYRTWSSFLLGCGALGFCGHAFGQADIVTVKEAVGWYDLEDRLGAGNVPTGAGIGVLQCEAPESTNNWIPNLADEVRYGGKTFTIPNGSPGTSNHANTVALEYYSNNGSIAPSISNIWLYEAINYVTTGYLNVGQSSSIPPIDSPDDSIRVHNHSWIGQFNNANDNLALRRMDFLSIRDNILMVNGTNNGGAAAHMFAHAFNTLTVGGDAGTHTTIDVPVTIDGPGRMKPWIVAPGDLTSYTTPIVSAVAAMLYETIETDSVLVDDFAAGRVQMMRAILLAGATHLEDWTNNPVESGDLRGSTDRPIDDVFGAGMVNVDRSHRILTGYRQTGTTSLESAPEISMTGWDWPRVLWNSQKHWRLSIDSPVEEMTVAITWQRAPGSTFTNYSLMDIDLELLQLVDGELVSLVGDGGVGAFESGNVLSNSRVDNVELLSITGLQPGEYVLRAQRQSTGDIPNTYAGIAWHITTGDPEPIPGDINEDGAVDGLDLSILLGAWGTDDPAADIVVDGLVDGGDLAALLGNWS
jgi:hypothetical protein